MGKILELNVTDFGYSFLVIRNIGSIHGEKHSSSTARDFISYLSLVEDSKRSPSRLLFLSELLEEDNDSP